MICAAPDGQLGPLQDPPLQCAPAWEGCELRDDPDPTDCNFEYTCPDGPHRFWCAPQDDSESMNCHCGNGDGSGGNYPGPADSCESVARAIDEANRNCGWRIPVTQVGF